MTPPVFPVGSDAFRRQRLAPPASAGPVRLVLDTDAFNQIDDQFAIVWALLSPRRLALEALYAAPFHNARSASPADGMAKSHAEILRILELVKPSRVPAVFRGSETYLPDAFAPVESPAARDLVERAMATAPDAPPLYVAAIGAPTNVASALLLEPAIAERIVVLWLGGHGHHWPAADDFNLRQDPAAARILFDSGVPFVHLPCEGVAFHLATTLPEMERHVRGKGVIGDDLFRMFRDHVPAGEPGRSKILWDLAPIAWLIHSDWVATALVPSPILTRRLTWAFDAARPVIRAAFRVYRDPIFGDFFRKLAAPEAAPPAGPMDA